MVVKKTLSVERSPLKRKPAAIWAGAILAILLLLSPWLWERDISDVAAASQPQQLQRALVRIDLPDETALKRVEQLGLAIYACLQAANTQYLIAALSASEERNALATHLSLRCQRAVARLPAFGYRGASAAPQGLSPFGRHSKGHHTSATPLSAA